MTRRVVVVGGGVAGLTGGYRLSGQDVEVTVLEADEDIGGKVRSAKVAGLRLEAGPDSLLARKPWAVELCRELGLGDDLVPSQQRTAHVYADVGLLPLPSGPFGISTDLLEMSRWPGLSWTGKLRAAKDLVDRPRAGEGDESIGSLVRRRLGDEVVEALIGPLIGGLLAGDVDELSVLATFPELAAWERRNGGLILGARAAAGEAKAHPGSPMFLNLRGGLERLTRALAAALGPRVRNGVPVETVEGSHGAYMVRAGEAAFEADAVVFATPAFVTADLLGTVAPGSLEALRLIPYASTAVALLVYGEGTGGRLPQSSGFVAARGTLAMTGCTLVSRKWPDEAFGDRAVIRCFIGDEGVLGGSDERIVDELTPQLAELLGLPEEPDDARVIRWPRAMPQYRVGHLDLVDEIERALPPGVFLTGQAYRGTGLPDCVRAAGRVAEQVRGHLTGERRPVEPEHVP